MIDYLKGKIYTIRFYNTNEIYIGSTIQLLSYRFTGHKKQKTCSLYNHIKNNYDNNWNICYYELYENYPCNNKEELLKKEGEIIRLFKNDENYIVINKKIEFRTHKEYKEENKNKIKEYQDNYRQEHKENMKKYNEENKEKIIEYKKDYYEEHKDKLLKGMKDYYEEHKEKLLNKIKCECGGFYIFKHKSTHLKTKEHQNFLLK